MKNETRKHDENAKEKNEISYNKNEISGSNKDEVSRYVKIKFHVAIRENFTLRSR